MQARASLRDMAHWRWACKRVGCWVDELERTRNQHATTTHPAGKSARLAGFVRFQSDPPSPLYSTLSWSHAAAAAVF